MMSQRRSGILLHPTSLPGAGGVGTLGNEARRFVDFLEAAGQSLWQVLPLGTTGYGNSPYSSYSAFAGNPLVIDLAAVAAEGDLAPGDLWIDLPDEWVDFEAVKDHKLPLLRRAAGSFFSGSAGKRLEEFWHFCDTTYWLHDFALFMALKEYYRGKSWCQWPEEIAFREPSAVEEFSRKLGQAVGEHKYMQWQFFRQWHRLKDYANSKGIQIIGDVPIFVAYDSVDVWANRHLFHLDEHGKPTVVAGVPPDYFSKTGQLWGNPLYNWPEMAARGFSWWVERMRGDLGLYDMVRIDHFRGFEAYWEVPAGEKTAIHGRWLQGPGDDLFNALRGALGDIPFIAEDLGVITPEVEALRDRFGFPGMKILQFAFGSGPENPYLPHNFRRHCVVYTGTHDNDTTAGWFDSLSVRERKGVLSYIGGGGKDIVGDMMKAALASVARMAIFPLQDLLGLDSSARMNVPGKARGNWSWRCASGDLNYGARGRQLRELTELYGRLPK
ncbi:MAG TPA: 4-alpha-glucanotransferase [Geobacteraceae bacterium]